MRLTRRTADTLAEEQRVQYAALLEATREDRELCEAAFEAGFIADRVEGSLRQAEMAAWIRSEAERAGVPWRGLGVAELIEFLTETAEGRRGDLAKLSQLVRTLVDEAEQVMANSRFHTSRLEAARDHAISRVCRVIEQLVQSLRERERFLVEAAKEAAAKRGATLEGEQTCARVAIESSQALLHRINSICNNDHLKFLSALADADGSLDRDAAAIGERLGSVGSVRNKSTDDPHSTSVQQISAVAARAGPPPDPPLTNAASAEGLEVPQIDFRYDRSIHRKIDQLGTVGNLADFDLLHLGEHGLVWDEFRSDMQILALKCGNAAVVHSGPRDARATAFGKCSFNSGRAVLRVRLSGLLDGQWIALGVATADQLHSPRMVRDSMIFEAANSVNRGISNNVMQIPSGQVVTIVMNCDAQTIEYYKGGTKIKSATLPAAIVLPGPASTPRQFFFPYCTFFHPGQMAELVL